MRVSFRHDGLTTRAAEERFGESDGEFASDGGDRVLDVALGPDRRRLCVVDDREGEVFRGVRRLRGEWPLFRGSGAISCDAERRVVVEAAPSSPFEMGEAEFALEL